MDCDSAPRVLLVEDDLSVREALASTFEANGYRVCQLGEGSAARQAAGSFRPDLAVVDIRLPGGIDGFEVAAGLRAEADVPIVFLTAADELDDRLRAFDLGADDYVTKPFSTSELLARARAVLRRSGRLRSPTVEVRDLVVDEQSRTAVRAGHRLDLTGREFSLLALLARHPGVIFSKIRLLSEVWGFDEYDANLVEVHISALRRKLEAHGPRMIFTERSQGYVMRP